MLLFNFSRVHVLFHCGSLFFFISVPAKDSVQTFLFLPNLVIFLITMTLRGSGEPPPTSTVCLTAQSNRSWPGNLYLPDRDWLSLGCLPQLTIFSWLQPSKPEWTPSCLHTYTGIAESSILPPSAVRRHLKCLSRYMQKQWLILSHHNLILGYFSGHQFLLFSPRNRYSSSLRWVSLPQKEIKALFCRTFPNSTK